MDCRPNGPSPTCVAEYDIMVQSKRIRKPPANDRGTGATRVEEDFQKPFDAAVVIPTILRPTLLRSVKSVFSQTLPGRVQVLIGIDNANGDRQILDALHAACPERFGITVVDPGYSTSVRHGGLHPARDGGVLRTVLSYLANSRYVAYLDDDNWWENEHLADLHRAIEGVAWSFSHRWYVDSESGKKICIDRWESLGPGKGVFSEKAAGFVDPNSLMIDKLICEPVLRWWSRPLPGDNNGMSSDRHVFAELSQNYPYRETGKATCNYVMDPTDRLHRFRQSWIGE